MTGSYLGGNHYSECIGILLLLPAKWKCMKLQFSFFHDFLQTRIHVHKTVLVAYLCTWENVHVKEQTCILLIITMISQ